MLGQAFVLELQAVVSGRDFGQTLASDRYSLRHLLVSRFGPAGRTARFVCQQLLRLELTPQIGNFLLPSQHTGLLGVGRVKLYAVRIDEVAFRNYKHSSRWQCGSGA